MLHEMSTSDKNNTFVDTFCLAVVNNDVCTVKVLGFQNDGRVLVVPYRGEETTISLDELQLGNSDLGMFKDTKGETYYIARRPQRQWRRGIRSSTLLAYHLKEDGEISRKSIENDFCHRIARHFLEKRKDLRGIINPNFAVVKGVLWFRTLPVGMVDTKSKVVTLNTKLNLPELEGYTYANG